MKWPWVSREWVDRALYAEKGNQELLQKIGELEAKLTKDSDKWIMHNRLNEANKRIIQLTEQVRQMSMR